MDLVQFSQLGVGVAAVVALYLVVKEVLKLIRNHISHNTEALTELKDAIRELKEFLLKNNKGREK